MPRSSPESNHDLPSDEDLQESLTSARHGLALNERARTLQKKLVLDWETYRQRIADGSDVGTSPVSLLKLEALASIAALTDFHCFMADKFAEAGMDEQAHGWAVDEGFLASAFCVLSQVDTESV